MTKLPIKAGEYWVDHFFRGTGNHPYFAVYQKLQLVCVCVYRKGAEEVLRRLTAENKPQTPTEGEGGIT